MINSIEIDKLTPCLERLKGNEIVNTSYIFANESELSGLKNWLFNWNDTDLKDCQIFKLSVEGDERIQGLVALHIMKRDRAVYVKIAESAPHNKGKDKEYAGVGGHLFAIAVQRSYELGYDGFAYFDAKNVELVKHYAETLGAVLIGHPHPYRMLIDEEAAYKLKQVYNFRRD